MDAQKYTKTGRRLDNGNETAITTGKFLGEKTENESDQTLTHHMRHLHRNYIGANQFAIRSVLADMEEKRGEETMNTCDSTSAISVLLHRTNRTIRESR